VALVQHGDGESDRFDPRSKVIDSATAAATVADLDAEIATLERLRSWPGGCEARGWTPSGCSCRGCYRRRARCSTRTAGGGKLIFTEHRDTMNYLVDRLRTIFGDADAVVNISGSTPPEECRATQARFTRDEDCLVLVATDVAGEGINLQRAHLVIIYDLPWNPNRIQQRFGRSPPVRAGRCPVLRPRWALGAAGRRASTGTGGPSP
jgi:hypothetical protein